MKRCIGIWFNLKESAYLDIAWTWTGAWDVFARAGGRRYLADSGAG